MNKIVGILGSVLRIAAAVAVVWVCAQDLPAIQARARFDELPQNFDYWKEADTLLNQERFSEAMMVVDEGLVAAPESHQGPLQQLKKTIQEEQGRWMFRFQQFGRGALLGTGQSMEALGGAVVADLFVFGDVRDLVIQAGRRLKGEETDPVIVGLSAGGILLSVNPAADLGGALLKFARRMGSMSADFARALGDALKRAVSTRNADEVTAIADDLATISKQSRPAVALAILKHVDDPAELRVARRFAEKPGGVFTLWLGQKETLRWLKVSAGNEDLMLKAARRGRAGFQYLKDNAQLMFRMHPLLGLIKGLYKGNVPGLLLEWMRRYSEVVLGFAGGWLAYELALLIGRIVASDPTRRAPPPPPELPEGVQAL
jgi:hypothetical protein